MWDYVEDVVEDRIVSCEYIKKACQRFIDDCERDDWEWRFDLRSAAKYINFIERICLHTRGETAGTKFILDPWQVFFVGQIFGWVDKSDIKRRRFTTAHLFVARKNGKSQLAAAIALAMGVLDGDGAPQLVTAATKRDQAREVFDEICRCIKSSAPLSKRFNVHRAEVKAPRNGVIKPLSSDANTLDGLNLNLAVVDEFHAMKNADLYRVLASSMGSRKAPLMLAITTAGFVPDGPCAMFMKAGKSVLDGINQNDRLLILPYEIDEDDAWDDTSAWIKANPNLNTSISQEYLDSQCKNAKLYGSRSVTEFMVKHLNVFVGSSAVWIPGDDWMTEDNCREAHVTHVIDEKTNKPVAYLGLDLAATDDISAVAICTGNEELGWGFEMHYFLPERAIERRLDKDENTMYLRFQDLDNVHVTKGNVTDYNVIRRLISGNYIEDGRVKYDKDNLMERYLVKGVAYDRWNSLNLIRDLEGDGVPCDPYGQGFASMSFPSKEFEKAALNGKLVHAGDEVLEWMMGNVSLRYDPSGNIKPDKAKSGDKIDGVVAAVMAIGEALTFEEDTSTDFEFFMAVVGGSGV
jgi:phage terminase large subunit-like protein